MSDPRIALIVEGPTDAILIEAAIRTIFGRPIPAPTIIQPEPTLLGTNGGWGGVYKWCRQSAVRRSATADIDPVLSLFDLVIIHLDADVADASYSDLPFVVDDGMGLLPCSAPCPPPHNTVIQLEVVLSSWLGMAAMPGKTIFCIPSKCIESWLAAALFDDIPRIVSGLECAGNMEGRLSSLPHSIRVHKNGSEYRNHAGTFSAKWSVVTDLCSQALKFDRDTRTFMMDSTLTQ